MKMTPAEKKKVEELRNSPDFKLKPGLTDEEVLAAARFVEDGSGIEVWDSEEEYRAAMKKRNTDEIEEI